MCCGLDYNNQVRKRFWKAIHVDFFDLILFFLVVLGASAHLSAGVCDAHVDFQRFCFPVCFPHLLLCQIGAGIQAHSRFVGGHFFFFFFLIFFFWSGPGGFRSMFPYGFMCATCVGV